MSTYDYSTFQSRDVFDWRCPRCLAPEMPFNDCSTLASQFDMFVANSTRSSQSSILAACRPSCLSIAHMNARSIVSCVDEIQDLLTKSVFDILMVSETWLDESVSDAEICPPFYSVVRIDMVEVLLSTSQKGFDIVASISCGLIESIWVEIFPKSVNRSMVLCCTYRSPSTSPLVYFDHLHSERDSAILLQRGKSCRLTIIGNLNCDVLDSTLSQTKILWQFCRTRLISEPTSVFNGCTSLLDLVLTNCVDRFQDVYVKPFSALVIII